MHKMSAYSQNTDLVISYLTLRKAVGYLGITLPFVLSFGAFLFFGDGLQSSISSYYYTGMRNVFVGVLCAIGVFMLSYRGYERKDDIAGDIACFSAVGAALFPTSPDIHPTPTTATIGAVHWTFAAVFLGTLAYFSLFLFTKTGKKTTSRKLQRNRVYRGCGWIMIACLILISTYKLLPDSLKNILSTYHPVYWLESAAVLAFGSSWLVKGETILKDKA
jgi:hypothetical protein